MVDQSFRIGDPVRFQFGAGDAPEVFGTVEAFSATKGGEAAAVIAVAGVPGWRHLEPLSSLKRASVVGSVLWRAVERIQRRHHAAKECRCNIECGACDRAQGAGL